MRRVGIDSDRAIDVVIGGIIAALIGARAYYVILNWEEYKDDLLSVFNTREGGLAVLGGLIGAVLVGGILCKIRKVKFLPMMDLCGVGFLIGQGIGRWGNFTNQEAFGKNTNSLFAMSGGRVQQWIAYNYNTVTQYDKDITVEAAYPVHPCFLYESAWCLLGALLLAVVLKKWRKFDGQIILMYMVWYGLGRFFIESLRTDSLMIGSLRVSQGVAALMFVAGVILLIIGFARVKRLGSDYMLYVDTAESKALLAEADKRIAEEEARKAAKKSAKETIEQIEEEAEKIVPEEDEAPENTEAEKTEE